MSEKKPRRFWILPSRQQDLKHYCGPVTEIHPEPGTEFIPVIEASAYDQLLQRNGELLAEIAKRKEIGEATAKVLQECADREAELEKENERLRGVIILLGGV